MDHLPRVAAGKAGRQARALDRPARLEGREAGRRGPDVRATGGAVMEKRTLGRTGIAVSTIGFGAWAIGGDAWGEVDDRESLAAIERALDLGVTFFDTADV